MLSRVAEACFWLGRYVERAENVARILDVNYHGVIENSEPDASPAWWSVVATTGDAETFFARYPHPSERNVAEFLLLDRENANSVARCITAARESARSIRDHISSETWEELNRFYHVINRHSIETVMLDGPYAFCRSVRNISHLISGVIHNTMPHDEAWMFLRAGRYLERAGMTARIIDSQAPLLAFGLGAVDFTATHRWIAVLKSASAYEAYRKLVSGPMTSERVVGFLLLSPEFPRSALAALTELEEALLAVRANLGLRGPGQAARDAGELAARLRYTDVNEAFMPGLHQFLDQLEAACNTVGDAIAGEYFWGRIPLQRGA